ncbi:MAG TPA: hypothetical protein VFG10_19055 [Saprospiraceae bacterium]|nr:hypothetical protein [Saprospiraceae bacterium]
MNISSEARVESNYRKMFDIATKQIQELHAQNDSLQKRIVVLEKLTVKRSRVLVHPDKRTNLKPLRTREGRTFTTVDVERKETPLEDWLK